MSHTDQLTNLDILNNKDNEPNPDDDEENEPDKLSLTNDSELYVICVDNIPQYYVQSEKLAKERMWDTSRLLSSKMIGYHINYMNIAENELHLIGAYSFFLVQYDRVLHRISYHIVNECA